MQRTNATLALILLCVCGLITQSCLKTSSTIIAHQDGSATVVDTVLFPKMVMEFLKGFSTAFDSTANTTNEETLFADSTFLTQASSMGEGVTFREKKDLEIDSMIGYVATFNARSINRLKMDKNSFHSKMGSMNEQPEQSAGKTYALFSYADGTLTINNPMLAVEPNEMDDTTSQDAQMEQLDMAAGMLKDMHVAMRVRVDGTIISTNASFVSGSELTLMEFHFGELLDSLKKNPEIFSMMKGIRNQQPGQLEQAMNKLGRGARFETQPTITVRFR